MVGATGSAAADRAPEPDLNAVAAARLTATRSTGLLEHRSTEDLDRICWLACRLAGVPTAVVGLLDSDCERFVGAAGLAEPWASRRQAPLTHSFSAYVASSGAALVIPDARRDAVHRHNRAVDELDVVAYAGVPLPDEAGHVLGALWVADAQPRQWTPRELEALEQLAEVTASDIAARTHARSLTLAVAEHAAVLDATLEASVSIDPCGRVTAWNRSATETFGWSAEEALGQQIDALVIPPAYRQAHLDGLARAVETGRGKILDQRLELPAVRRDGSEVLVELTLTRVERPRGAAFHAFLHDITDRVRLERERAHERGFLMALLESLDAGVLACDARGKVSFTNRALREIPGLDASAVGSLERTAAPDSSDAPGAAEAHGGVPLARALAGEHLRDVEVRVASNGEPPRLFLANGQAILSAEGEKLGAVVAMQDVTDRRKLERMAACELAVAKILAGAATTEQAAHNVLDQVATALDAPYAELWLLDATAERMECAAHWTQQGRDFTDFLPAGQTFGPGEGVPGRIWTSEEPLWVSDLAADPTFERSSLAAATGLRTAIAAPVRSAAKTVGALAFFFERLEEPEPIALAVLNGIAGHVGEVLDRRRTEELALALATAREDLNRVMSSVDDYFFTVEFLPSGEVRSVYASKHGLGVFGGSLDLDEDLAGALARMVLPEDQELFAQFHADASAGRPAETECRLLGVDGEVRWVWTRGHPRREGERLLFDGICSNVTERHKLTKELHENRAFLQAMLDNSDAIIYAKDVEGRYLFVNRAHVELFGIPENELAGRTDYDMFPPAIADALTSNDRAVLLSGRLQRIEELVPSGTGERNYLSSKFPLFGLYGEPVGVCGISIDITDRTQVEAQREELLAREREQVQRLQELDWLKDEFVALASHELRTPLTSVHGYTELLLDEVDALSPQQAGFVRTIQRNSERLLRLVAALLDLTKIVNDAISLDVQPMSMSQCISDAIESIKPAAAEKQLTLDISLPGPATLKGDSARLRQVVDNVLSNAVKYTPEGGCISVDLTQQEATLRLAVRDTGIGIPEQELPQLFRRFFRASSATARHIEGTGLGLAISKAIVDAHGGTISVERAEPGTVFVVELPAVVAAVAPGA